MDIKYEALVSCITDVESALAVASALVRAELFKAHPNLPVIIMVPQPILQGLHEYNWYTIRAKKTKPSKLFSAVYIGDNIHFYLK